ncbi:AAA family ATPase [Treponema sp.]|uniref:AAA family ATPase n=1 Tax=Treponema sp. TaxID=166 RepID=UPI00388D4CA1
MYKESYTSSAVRTLSNSPSYMPSAKYGKPENEVLTITGKTEEECVEKLFNMYGHNYTPLGKRQKFKPGIFGFGQKEYWEVRYSIGAEQKPLSQQDSFQKNRDELLSKASSAVSQTVVMANLDKKLEEMKKTMETTMKNIAAATNAADKPVSIQKVEEFLQENEFTFSYINKITTRLKSELSVEQLEDFNFVQEKVIDWIGESLKISPKTYHPYPHVIILVGPTGVGKTTTIAKLAGTMILEARNENQEEPKIRMITIDHTRVGAEEQLKRYGDLLGANVDKAESAEDVKKIIDTYRDNIDVLFIDTPGYSPNDSENIGKMRKMLEIKGIQPDVYLTFTASAKARDMISIIQNYEPFNFSSVIITKWDETSAIGNVISVLTEKNKSVSYITDGQQVPRKIERASVLKFLLNLNYFSDFRINREHISEKFPEEK